MHLTWATIVGVKAPGPVFRYTSSRILLFVVVAAVLSLFGLRSLLLLAVALVVSGLLSFVLLSRQRDAMSAAVVQRTERVRRRMAESTEAEDRADDERRATVEDPDADDRDRGQV